MHLPRELGHRVLVVAGRKLTDLAFAANLMLSLLGIVLVTLAAPAETLLGPWHDTN